MSMKIECAGYKQNSCDDGPGIRDVLFLQGCRKNCPGCQNKSQQFHGNGVWKDIDELVDEIADKCKNKKITISGGEPLEQKEALCILGNNLKKRGFQICVYTGWNWNQLPKEIFQFADIIKAGPYIQELKRGNLRFIGSDNQIMKRKNDSDIWEEINLAG